MRSKGCSGTTVHSKNFGMARLPDEDETRVLLLPGFPGRESRPLYFVRPDSQAARLCRRDLCSSSSAVANGRRNSREAPRGAWTWHPLITRIPSSNGLPDSVTGWYELAGTVTGIGFVSNGTPEVLRNPCKLLPQRIEWEEATLGSSFGSQDRIRKDCIV